MRNILGTVVLAAAASVRLSLFAQIPTVPSHINIGDMRLTITDGAKKDIQKDVNMLRASDRFFKIKLDRAVLYMPVIERIFREQGIPDEFKYLAIQESALISDVVSASKAVGFWQFKDFTAKEVGLRVDGRVDERKNIVSSTYGAARYFNSHQKRLSNWAHTVTAHMTGLGGVEKYISQKDYGSKKMVITTKSHWYLKRFLAHIIAFQDELDHRHSEDLTLIAYEKGAGKDLRKIAREFQVEHELLQHYNKWLKQDKIPTDKDYTVAVPVKKGSRRPPQVVALKTPAQEEPATVHPTGLTLILNLKKPAYISVNGVKALLAEEGDTFDSLAKKSGLQPKKLLKINELNKEPEIRKGDFFFVGKKKSKSKTGFHVVQPGETLWSVAHHYGIKRRKLASMNRLSVIDEIEPGLVLWLSQKRPSKMPPAYLEPDAPLPSPVVTQKQSPKPTQTPPPRTTTERSPARKQHTVQSGETLWGISRQYGVSVEELRALNRLTKYDVIRPGQVLALHNDAEKDASEPSRATKEYIVKPGDTLYHVAKSHNMEVSELMELNQKEDSHLNVGEVLKVFQ